MSNLIINYDLSVQPATDRDSRIRDAAPEMLESLRDAVLFMQFLGKNERGLTDSEQRWLDNAVTLLRKIENDDPQSALAERIKLSLDRIESEGWQ